MCAPLSGRKVRRVLHFVSMFYYAAKRHGLHKTEARSTEEPPQRVQGSIFLDPAPLISAVG